ncbi:hypothetical protein cyc_04954 [Cyclospora cayetanensis]|uniref:Uncharacterized protein n=1 Tax=Cyclospora cayetanensis TaxID=88456 RepID=A0A1D3DAF8_9EIME|nr:hypothetical protein cyc_04954 [Cyclospora cayetanensis]
MPRGHSSEGSPHSITSSRGSSTPPDGLRFADRPRLWQWRFRHGGHSLPRYAPQIPHFLEAHDPEDEIGQLLHALTLNKRLPDHAQELAKHFADTKHQLEGLLQEKELLEWHNSNTKKELLLKRSEARALNQKVTAVKNKIFSGMELLKSISSGLAKETISCIKLPKKESRLILSGDDEAAN